MNSDRFDAAHAVSFDLSSGQVGLERSPRVLIPVSALQALCESAGAEAARDFGRLVGTELGRRVADRLSVESADTDSMVEHLGGEIALLGLGSLGLEHWGAALVFTISTTPFGPISDGWIAGVFEGALQRALGRQVNAVELPRVGGTVRVLLAGEQGAQIARRGLAAGKDLVELAAELNAAGSDI